MVAQGDTGEMAKVMQEYEEFQAQIKTLEKIPVLNWMQKGGSEFHQFIFVERWRVLEEKLNKAGGKLNMLLNQMLEKENLGEMDAGVGIVKEKPLQPAAQGPERKDYEKMKVAELKELLKAAGKPVGGKKDQLIDRLLGLDGGVKPQQPQKVPPHHGLVGGKMGQHQPQGIGDLLGQQQPQKGGGVNRWRGVKPVGAGPWSDEASFSGNVGDIAKLEGPEAGGMLYDDSDYPEAIQEQIAAAWNRLNEIVYNEGVGAGEAYFDNVNLDTIFAPMNPNGVRYLQPGMRSGKIVRIMWPHVMMKMKDNLRYVWPAGLIAA